jgi:glycosyltransferase involved in cell wall biosynthesis
MGTRARTSQEESPSGWESDMAVSVSDPTVSVIIATWQRPHLLQPLIESTLSDPGSLEVIVVIDGFDDLDSVRMLDELSNVHPSLSYFCQEHGGQLQALQRGVLAARGEVVLLLDDDVLPVSNLASGHAFRHRGADNLVVVGSMSVATSNGGRAGVASRIYSESYEKHCQTLLDGNASVLEYLWLGNVSLRRGKCLTVGISSDSFVSHYYRDREFGYRLADSGLVGVFDPSLRALHLHSQSPDAFLRYAQRQGAGLRTLHSHYPDRLGPFSPRLLVSVLPYPVYLVLLKISQLGWTPVRTARILLRIGLFAGQHNLVTIETILAKMAQHLMQWHGASVYEVAKPTHI